MEERKMSRKKRLKTDIALILAIVFAFVQMLPGVVVADGYNAEESFTGQFTPTAMPEITDIEIFQDDSLLQSRSVYSGETRNATQIDTYSFVNETFEVTGYSLSVHPEIDGLTTMGAIAEFLNDQLVADGVTDVAISYEIDGDSAKLVFTGTNTDIDIDNVSTNGTNLLGIENGMGQGVQILSLSPMSEYKISVHVDGGGTLEDLAGLELRIFETDDIDNATFAAVSAGDESPVTFASISLSAIQVGMGENDVELTTGAVGLTDQAFNWELTDFVSPTNQQLSEDRFGRFDFTIRVGAIAKYTASASDPSSWHIAGKLYKADVVTEPYDYRGPDGTKGIDIEEYFALIMPAQEPQPVWNNIDAGTTLGALEARTSVSGIDFLGNTAFSMRATAADEWHDQAQGVSVLRTNQLTAGKPTSPTAFALAMSVTNSAIGTGYDAVLKPSTQGYTTITTTGAISTGGIGVDYDFLFNSFETSRYTGDTWLFLALGDDVAGGYTYTGDITYAIRNYID